MWRCSFFKSFGLVRGCLWKRLILVTSAQDAQFQCRLFRLVQALIFGVHVVFLVHLCGLFACYLGGWGGLSCSIGANHCRLRHIGWERCGHGLTSRPRESASEPFKNEFYWGSFDITPNLVVLCLKVHFLFVIVLLALLAVVPLGGYLTLVMLLVWLLLSLVLRVRLLIALMMRFLGFVDLVRDEREFD